MPDTNTTTDSKSDDTTETGDATSTDTGTGDGGQPAELGDAGKKALESERNARKAAEKEAKELRDKFEGLQRSQMSDQEKAIADAREAGKLEGLAAGASLIAQAEFRAAAAGRLTDDQVTKLIPGLDVKAFLADDGTVDSKKIRDFVDGIAPARGQRNSVDLGQGARGSAPSGSDMNSVIRRSAGRR